MNDLVIMIALFLVIPIIWLVVVFFAVKRDAADPRYQTVPYDYKADSEE